MPVAIAESQRFTTQSGTLIAIQVPEPQAERVLAAITGENPLVYGDYDCVSFSSAQGVQRFCCLGTGRNPATDTVVEVPCVELRVFVDADKAGLERIVAAIYAVHPYEEPVIVMQPCLRSLHIRGMDEDNPMRFWNAEAADDWVPDAHRK